MMAKQATTVSKSTLGFIINTMDGNVLNNTVLLEQIAAIQAPVLIINQVRKQPTVAHEWPDGISVIDSGDLGLSRGRNLALNEAPFSFAVLCDDDIQLCPESLVTLKEAIPSCVPNTACIRTQLLREGGQFWRDDYPAAPEIISRSTPLFWRRIQKINSMELVLNLDWIREKNIWFNEQLGLGSENTNGGEEVVFLHDVLTNSGVIQFLPISLRIHEGESSGEGMSALHAFTLGVVHKLTAPNPMWLPVFWFRFVQKSILRGWKLGYSYRYFAGLVSTDF